MKFVYKTARIVTLPPILAAFTLLMFQIFFPEAFPTFWHFGFMLFDLGILPILSYPIQMMIPYFKSKGRDGQRTLAMIFSVVGYFLAAVTCIFTKATPTMWVISLEYLLSGILIFVFNKLLHVKASGHGCGSAGPLFMLIAYRMWIPAAVMAVLTVISYIASVKMKRHTVGELLGGSAISVVLVGILLFAFHISL